MDSAKREIVAAMFAKHFEKYRVSPAELIRFKIEYPLFVDTMLSPFLEEYEQKYAETKVILLSDYTLVEFSTAAEAVRHPAENLPFSYFDSVKYKGPVNDKRLGDVHLFTGVKFGVETLLYCKYNK